MLIKTEDVVRSNEKASSSVDVVLISVQGNIGSGKSTLIGPLLKALKSNDKIKKVFKSVHLVPEPVDQWIKPLAYSTDVKEAYDKGYQLRKEIAIKEAIDKNPQTKCKCCVSRLLTDPESGGEIPYDFEDKPNSMLAKYYQNPAGMAFPMQIMALTSRTKMVEEALKHANSKTGLSGKRDDRPVLLLSERSVFSDRNVFFLNNVEAAHIDPAAACAYDCLYRQLAKKPGMMEDCMVYVDCPIDVCKERIDSRNRNGETEIDLMYLSRLRQRHAKMMRENRDVKAFELCTNDSMEATMKKVDAIAVQLAEHLCDLRDGVARKSSK